MEPRHRKLAEIALAVAGDQGFALAGGYAIRAHGMGDRPSGDVDLFTDWHRRADFPGAVEAVIAALERDGYIVNTTMSGEIFARLLVSPPTEPDAAADKLELSGDWRAHPIERAGHQIRRERRLGVDDRRADFERARADALNSGLGHDLRNGFVVDRVAALA